MAEIITAAEAKEAVQARKLAREESYVAGLIDEAIDSEKYECSLSNVSEEIIKKLEEKGYYVSKVVNAGSDYGYNVIWNFEGSPEFTPAASIEDIANILAGDEEKVLIEVTEPISIAKGAPIAIPAGKKATIKIDKDITVAETGFAVADGAELILKGEGTVKSTNKSTKGAIVEANGKNALVTVDGVTLDCITETGKNGNYAFAIYLLNDASLNFKSGIVKTAYGSCISTNNTTGGNTLINITGGELYSDGSYAIYLAAQGVCNIKGGKVQGVNVRMGHINISGTAEIIPTTITADSYDNIGVEFATSGCVWLGDSIAVMAGTYTDEAGTDCVINIKGDATVKSDFRSAIGVYCVDLKEAQNVKVMVANKDNVTTTDEEFEAIKVYDHAYIEAEATAHGKTYAPVAESTVIVE